MADDNPNRGLPAGIIHEYPVADPLFPPGAAQNVGPEGIVPYMQMVPNMIMAPVVMPLSLLEFLILPLSTLKLIME
jgi:hypothetical protein